jgi:hypothetical protein
MCLSDGDLVNFVEAAAALLASAAWTGALQSALPHRTQSESQGSVAYPLRAVACGQSLWRSAARPHHWQAGNASMCAAGTPAIGRAQGADLAPRGSPSYSAVTSWSVLTKHRGADGVTTARPQTRASPGASQCQRTCAPLRYSVRSLLCCMTLAAMVRTRSGVMRLKPPGLCRHRQSCTVRLPLEQTSAVSMAFVLDKWRLHVSQGRGVLPRCIKCIPSRPRPRCDNRTCLCAGVNFTSMAICTHAWLSWLVMVVSRVHRQGRRCPRSVSWPGPASCRPEPGRLSERLHCRSSVHERAFRYVTFHLRRCFFRILVWEAWVLRCCDSTAVNCCIVRVVTRPHRAT